MDPVKLTTSFEAENPSQVGRFGAEVASSLLVQRRRGSIGEAMKGGDVKRSANFEAAEKRRQELFRAKDWLSVGAREARTRHAHVLANECAHENLFKDLQGPEGAISFFGARAIGWWKSVRSGDDAALAGPTANLCSSQVNCVNFLLPLARHPQALVAALKTIDEDVEGVLPIRYGANALFTKTELSSPVEFEWVGLEQSLEGTPPTRGSKCTSADALVLAKVKGGVRAYFFEWKYIETGAEKSVRGRDETRIRRYASRFPRAFNAGLDVADFLRDPLYQFVRLELLADRMVREPAAAERGLAITEAKVVLVCPENNREFRGFANKPLTRKRFPRAANLEDIMRSILRDPRQFAMTSQEALLRGIDTSSFEQLSPWRQYQRDRYGW